MDAEIQTTEPTWTHITNRGARQLPIFGNPADCRSFLALLGRESERADVEIHAYVFMPNHFHILARGTSDGVAEMMQYATGLYTRRFNRKYGFDGSLLRGRYHAEPVDSDYHLLAVVRYIHQNPFVDGGLHRMLNTFRWTSHPAYLGEVPRPQWLRTGEVMKLLGGDVSGYRKFIETDAVHSADIPTPSVRFADLGAIETALGINSPGERLSVAQGGRGIRNTRRLAMVLLATELADVSAETIADRYGFGSASSVRSASSRARARSEEDIEFAALVQAARQRLSMTEAA